MNNLIKTLQSHSDISAYCPIFIRNMIQHRISELSFDQLSDYNRYLELNEFELDKFLGLLKNSYSQFFRNRLTFEILLQVILPRSIIQNAVNDEIRIWSVACAGGHEPYSLALVFEKFNQLNSLKLKYRIFATDRDYFEIERAVLGVYSDNDIANLSHFETKNWFLFDGDNYKIKAELKKNIQFELFDLLDSVYSCPCSSIFGSFNFIMCANVLIYYNEETQKQIVAKLKKCIAKNGYIISGEAERELFLTNGFLEIFPQSCIFKLV